jgi:diguanylate cyclase (GGDEF)-like protein/putative nucleotidyltransferase with HDIG domain
MSTFLGTLARRHPAVRGHRAASGLSLTAKAYFAVVAGATAAAALPQILGLGFHTHGWPTFLVLATSAGIAQLFVVRTPRDHAYHTSLVFLIAAALLLPPELVALMGVVQHIPEWLRLRYAWYIQAFNVCNYTLNGLAAWGAARLVGGADLGLHHGSASMGALAGLAACTTFVLLNHVLLAGMLYFGRGHTPRETGLFSGGMLSTDLVLAALGIGLAAAWRSNPWLVPFAVSPLLLIHRSLHVPQLEEQARIDPKTGLFNARHFSTVLSDELARAQRFERPLSLIMADLDLLRDVNNTFGHLAGDAVLETIADVFRSQLRHYDLPARFGGEEFAILLPETPHDQALEIAERVRRAVAARSIEVETSSEPIRVTISIGVASFPSDGRDSSELVHHADLAVYRAKLQGRNRVLGASSEPLLLRGERTPRLVAVPAREPEAPTRRRPPGTQQRRQSAHPRPAHGPRLFSLSSRVALLVGLVGTIGIAAGALGLAFGTSTDIVGLLAVAVLVGAGQALALGLDDGSISVATVGALTAAALFGPRAALALAGTQAIVDWSARRSPVHQVVFNVGALSLAFLGAAEIFHLGSSAGLGNGFIVGMGVIAGAVYYALTTGLLSLALSVEGRERWLRAWQERFRWLLPHYVSYGLIGGVLAVAYHAAGIYALAVAIVPLLLMRRTQAVYLAHMQSNAQKLREAADTIHSQNVSLQRANRLLRERSTAAMESLSATVDARDSHTTGHSRRVRRIALAIGEELGLSRPELDLLGHAALFHDIGKLGIPDAILLKPKTLDRDEWKVMRMHSDEGARMIDRLGFLEDAVPAIRHHHERYDGSGYPDRLKGEEIPLGARIIHVADAVDSMLTPRGYRERLTQVDALEELHRAAGTQFCPRCVTALERVLPLDLDGMAEPVRLLAS